MENLSIVEGNYNSLEETVIRFTNIVETVYNSDVTINDCVNTINALISKKNEIISNIDAEIAYNTDRLNRIKTLLG